MIDFELGNHQKVRQAEFRRFAAEQIAPQAAGFDQRQAISSEIVTRLAARGYLGSHISEDYGGLGLDMITYGLLHAEIGKACASVRSLLTVHDMVAEVVLRVGDAEQRHRWLPRLTRGEVTCAFALTEPHAGSDAGAISTTAVESSDGYLLTGKKKWISFGQIADMFLVIAHVGEGGPIGAFLLERNAPGLTITPMRGLLGMRASMLAELEMDGCIVPHHARVGAPGLPSGFATDVGLNLGRYSVAWGSLAIGDAAMEASLHHSGERRQFGATIGDHQLIRRMLANMVADVRAARLLCLEAGFLNQQRDPSAIQATLIAKYFASQMASRVAGDAVQVHGALGCSGELPVERYFRDARLMEIIEGSNEIHQLTIAGLARRKYAHQTHVREE
jgi:alkylation response protein AidB-like acyl-CoA dehydrogenase